MTVDEITGSAATSSAACYRAQYARISNAASSSMAGGRSCCSFARVLGLPLHELHASKETVDDARASGSEPGTLEPFEQLDELLLAGSNPRPGAAGRRRSTVPGAGADRTVRERWRDRRGPRDRDRVVSASDALVSARRASVLRSSARCRWSAAVVSTRCCSVVASCFCVRSSAAAIRDDRRRCVAVWTDGRPATRAGLPRPARAPEPPSSCRYTLH